MLHLGRKVIWKTTKGPVKTIMFYVYKAYIFAKGMFKMSRRKNVRR